MTPAEDFRWDRFADFFNRPPDARIVGALISRVLEREPSTGSLDRGRWLALTERFWGDDFRIAFEGRLLAEVAADPALASDRSRRAAILWGALTVPGRWGADHSCDPFMRWHPLPPKPATPLPSTAAVSLVRAIRGRKGAAYAIPFPVVNERHGWDSLVVARVTRLRERDDEAGAPASGLLSRIPPVVLAPWSEYVPDQDHFAGLLAAVRATPGLDATARFLLELETPPEFEPSRWVFVEGNSSDLAIMLAALTVEGEPPYLMPFVATGRNHDFGGGREIGTVGHVRAKWDAAVRYARARRERVSFLMPEEDYRRIARQDDPDSFPLETPHVVSGPVPRDPGELRAFVRRALSDGCDPYRDGLRADGEIPPADEDITPPGPGRGPFIRDDLERLDDFAARSRDSGPIRAGSPIPLHILPCHNDPRKAARRLALTVLGLDREEKKTIPLVFPLHDARGVGVDDLVEQVRRGTAGDEAGRAPERGWPRPGSSEGSADETTSLVPPEVLRNLLLFSGRRLLLLLHDRPSTEVGYTDADRMRVRSLVASLREHTPDARAAVIASDLHHAIWLAGLGVVDSGDVPGLPAAGTGAKERVP